MTTRNLCSVIAVTAVLALAGCGSSSGGGGGSGANADHSSALAVLIEQQASNQLQQNDSVPGTTDTVDNVTCVRSGNTQDYSCIGNEETTNGVNTQTIKASFAGSCSNSGECVWRSQ